MFSDTLKYSNNSSTFASGGGTIELQLIKLDNIKDSQRKFRPSQFREVKRLIKKLNIHYKYIHLNLTTSYQHFKLIMTMHGSSILFN